MPTLPSADRLDSLLGCSAISTTDLSDTDLATVLDLSEWMAAADRSGVRLPLLEQEMAYAVFFDNSTRTRSAWAGAAARLGMLPVVVDGGSTQVAHGETAAETGAMLGMNAHALGIRHDLILGEGSAFMREVKRGIDEYLAHTGARRRVPVINLQCDVDHPTQTLADALWLRERFPEGLSGKKVAVSWAYSPSYAKPLSVPQGLAMLLPRLGAHVMIAHPPGYPLHRDALQAARAGAEAGGGRLDVVEEMDEAFVDADVVYPKSWGPFDRMMQRTDANRDADPSALRAIERECLAMNAEHRHWICDERRMGLTRGGDALYMHCLPADVGAEVSAGVMARHRFDVARQANGKVYVIMALLAAAKVRGLHGRLSALA